MSCLFSRKKLLLLTLTLVWLSACTSWSNRQYVERLSGYRHIKRVAIFFQRWPVYLQLQGEGSFGQNFIDDKTIFIGPWEPAETINPRAVDISNIDDQVMGKLIVRELEKKGYQPVLADFITLGAKGMNVAGIMAAYRVADPAVDACLFCFYSPTLFFADAQATPKDHAQRSFSLGEIIKVLNPGGSSIIWAGPRAAWAPPNSISHAFIYFSMSLFTVQDWRPLWKVADSQVGGRIRLALTQCPPAPTEKNYRVTAPIIERLMCQNLSCRLQHMLPDAF
ncbi:MAG: hypothetical protein BZ151_09675 [Desulfobacca sp. 4484_104]|nr:MAG: hypothetical protein BZ151_09675 [Desulfobacca sp. 4484_104]RLA89558.1 MAG: hypothetical protein DRG58_04795 [Deltaproteobacteria bacterium]